ncbi:hypothetical protein ABIC02_007468 [Bradyrhizobium sp. RT5a]
MRMVIIMITAMAMSTAGTIIITAVMATITVTTITTVVPTTTPPMRPGCSTPAPIPLARRSPV